MNQELSGIELPTASQADRRIAFASRGHCTAHIVLGENEGYRVQAESHLELCNLFVLNSRLDVRKLREQALFEWENNGHSGKHYFDVLAYLRNGFRIAFTVKPWVRVSSGRFKDEMREITTHALNVGFCDEVRLVTERDIDPIDQRNAIMFAAVRTPDPEAEEVAMSFVSTLKGSASLRDLTIRTEINARGYRALIRLIRNGILIAEARQLITPKTHVRMRDTYR